MRDTSKRFSDDDRARINAAIQEAESLTSAEIVPVVAGSSGRYDRPEDIVGLWIALLALVAVWAIFPRASGLEDDWSGPSDIWEIFALLAAVLLGFILGVLAGSRVAWLRRLFTPQQQMREEVYRRARAVFFDQRVHHTAGSSGLLLYVSLFERMAAVIADEIVLEKLGQKTIDEICGQFTCRLHDAGQIDAICQTARDLGQRLAPVLPRADIDANELTDALVWMEE